MALPKLLGWLVLAVGALLLLAGVVWVVSAVVSFVWWVIQTAIALAVIGALLYGGYKLYGWLSDDSGTSTSRSTSPAEYSTRPEDRIDDLQQRYTSGNLSESELERQLERELADDDLDSIDRELQRERS